MEKLSANERDKPLIAIDTNILIYAEGRSVDWRHRASLDLLDRLTDIGVVVLPAAGRGRVHSRDELEAPVAVGVRA